MNQLNTAEQPAFGFDRYCAEIVTQTDLMRSTLQGADLTTPVPTCPGWNIGRLIRHLGGAHRWIETIVRSRATEPPSDEEVRDVSRDGAEDPAALDAWLAEGAGQLADTLREAGPDVRVWAPIPHGAPNPLFYARRMTHETVVHRADATLAVGGRFAVDAEVALDAIDEWMELGSLPEVLDLHPPHRELLGPGRTLRFDADDAAAEWVVDLTGDVIAWRRAHEEAAVVVRGPLTDLLLTIYRRQPARSGRIKIVGDTRLFDFWLERVAFG